MKNSTLFHRYPSREVAPQCVKETFKIFTSNLHAISLLNRLKHVMVSDLLSKEAADEKKQFQRNRDHC